MIKPSIVLATAAFGTFGTNALAGTSGNVATPVPDSSGDWCETLKTIGNIHKNEENPVLQSFTLAGRLHYQAGHIDGNDALGDDFRKAFDDYRRARLGFRAGFLRYFELKMVANLLSDNRFRGRELDWGYQDFDEAILTFDIRKAFSVGALDTLTMTYGRHKYEAGYEALESSNNILTIERSPLSNKLYNGARPTGFSMQAGKEQWMVSAAVLSSEDDADFIGGFNDALVYFLSFDYKVSENLSLRADGSYNNASHGQDDVIGYRWAATLNAIYTRNPYGILGTVAIGDNGSKPAGRGGSFHGLVVMPWYWIVDKKLQAVFQYNYSGSDQSNGIRANTRYLSSSQTIAQVNSGRGDELHTFYLGLNYHVCGNSVKLMGGVEYADLNTPVGNVDSLTYTIAARFKF
jgi:hypothetical protein